MRTLLRIGFINLRRDRVVLAMVFLLPIVFFSIFALVFGGQENPSTSRVRIAVVDEDRSEVSARIVAGLQNETGLRTRLTADEAGKQPTLDRPAAERLVRNGDVPVCRGDSPRIRRVVR
jgi:ABC-2 type transport system permease protein